MSGPWRDTHMAAVGRLFEARVGMRLRDERVEFVERDLFKLMETLGIARSSRFLAAARDDASVFAKIVDELTIGESYFFRDEAKFDFLTEAVFPRWRRHLGRAPRIWCAGCSTGEEAYTLAIMVERARLPADTRIFATDVSDRALETARRGVYGGWSLRGAAPERMGEYVDTGRVTVAMPVRLKRRVEFRCHNLCEGDWPKTGGPSDNIDLIFCRNVLMYFEPQTVTDIAKRFVRCLAPGGYLVTAPSDPGLAHVPGLYRARGLHGVYQTHTGARETGATSARRRVAKPKKTRRAVSGAGVAPARSTRRRPPQARSRPDAATGPSTETVEPEEVSRLDERLRRIDALSREDLAEAERASRELVDEFRLEVGAYHMRTIILLALDRPEEAARVASRGIYLDRKAIMMHVALGVALLGCEDRSGARRAFENAAKLAAARPPDDIVALSRGERAGEVAAYAAEQARQLLGARSGSDQGEGR